MAAPEYVTGQSYLYVKSDLILRVYNVIPLSAIGIVSKMSSHSMLRNSIKLAGSA